MKILLCVLCTLCLFTGCKSSLNQIHIYVRDPASGTREAFENGISLEKVSDEAIETSSNDDMVQQLQKDINGIGYISFESDVTKHQLKVLTYDGIEATKTNVLNGTYPLKRPFAFITRSANDFEHNDKEQLICAFIDYLMYSSEAKLSITKHGGIVDLQQGIPWEQFVKKYPVLQKDNSHITIVTAGSTSVEPTLRACLQSFSPLAGNVSFVMNHSGSSDAYKRVLGKEKDGPNKADIGFVSRLWKENENQRYKALLEGIYCYDAVLLVTHQDNKINDLSKEQVQKIYNGTYQQWKEIYED